MASAAKRAGRETTEGRVADPHRRRRRDDRRRRLRDGARVEERRVPRVRREGARPRRRERPGARPRSSRTSASSSPPSSARTSSCAAPRASRPATARSLVDYVHPPANKIGVLVQLRGAASRSRARSRCTSPSPAPQWFMTRDEWPAEEVDAERARLREAPTRSQSKPEQARAEDRRGHARQALLRRDARRRALDQAWIREPGKSDRQGARARPAPRSSSSRDTPSSEWRSRHPPGTATGRARRSSAASCSSSRARR